jgi:hypothetical protein
MSSSCCSTCNKVNCSCVNGQNAFTATSASFVQPSVGSTVTVNVSNLGQLSGLWVGLGVIVYVVGGGYYEVTDVSGSPQSFVLENLGYAGNASPGATVPQGSLFSPGGLRGVPGASGSAASSVLFNNHTAVTLLGSAGSSPQAAFTYSMPDGTFAPDNSILSVDFLVDRTVLASQGGSMTLSIGGQAVASMSFFVAQESSRMRGKVEVTRISATAVRVDIEYTLYNPGSTIVERVSSYTNANVTVFSLDSGGPRAVVLSGSVGSSGDSFVCRYMTVRRYLA